MAVTVYRSTDASAPTLNGTVGSLISVLDACLVNGYGSKAAAGWTIAYTGTNTKAYRNDTTTGTGDYVNVNDNAVGTGGAREAVLTGFATMSAINTGTGQFPTSAQLNFGIGGVVCRKSATADSTARAWIMVADAFRFYLFTESADYTNPTAYNSLFIGDIISLATSDPYRFAAVGRNAVNTGSGANNPFTFISNYFPSGYGTMYIAALQTGSGVSTSFVPFSPYLSVATTTSNNDAPGWWTAPQRVPAPSPVDGSAWMTPVYVLHSGNLRGYFPGLWINLQNQMFQHLETFSGAGALSGKSFQVINLQNATAAGFGFQSQIIVETSDTWS